MDLGTLNFRFPPSKALSGASNLYALGIIKAAVVGRGYFVHRPLCSLSRSFMLTICKVMLQRRCLWWQWATWVRLIPGSYLFSDATIMTQCGYRTYYFTVLHRVAYGQHQSKTSIFCTIILKPNRSAFREKTHLVTRVSKSRNANLIIFTVTSQTTFPY